MLNDGGEFDSRLGKTPEKTKVFDWKRRMHFWQLYQRIYA